MHIPRRTFLELAAGGGLLAGLGGFPRRLRAATPTVTDRYFVFAYFQGGWDMLLGLDPRSPDDFPTGRGADTGIEPAYDTVDNLDPANWLVDTDVPGMTFGPFIGDLAQHASRLAVVRGMTMGSVAHEVARRHAFTGVQPAGTSVRASSVATLLAALLGESEPIPNLVCGMPSFNLGHPSWASGLGTESVDDLYEALSPGATTVGEGQRAALEAFFANQESRTSSPRALDIYANRRTARSIVDLDIAATFDLSAASAEMRALREVFGVDSGTTGEGGPRALMAAQALTHGVSRCVSFEATGDLDTHAGAQWQSDHGPNLRAGFDSVAALATQLAATPFFGDAGDNWLDHTTIVCLSEFAREAALNSNGGRDHNLVNAMVLLGGGIRGGQIIGRTTDLGMQAQPVDLSTGTVAASGEVLTNEHIARSLLHSIGVEDDVADYRADPVLSLLESR